MTTEESNWEIRMQLRKGGKIRTISKTLEYEEAITFLSFISTEYYGYENPRIWAHDTSGTSGDVSKWEKNVTVPDSWEIH